MPFKLTRQDTSRVKGTADGGRESTRFFTKCKWNEHIPEDMNRASTGRPTLCEVCGKKVKLCPNCRGFHFASKIKYAVLVERCNQEKLAQEFSLAAAAGDLDKIKELIDLGVDVNAYDNAANGATACYLSAERGHAHVVRTLLDFKASIRKVEREERMANTPAALAEQKRRGEEEAAARAAVEAAAASSEISASSKVREFALENDVNLTFVKGTGPSGKILKRDVQNYLHAMRDANESADASVSDGLPPTAENTFTSIEDLSGKQVDESKDNAHTSSHWEQQEMRVDPFDMDMNPTIPTTFGLTPMAIAARNGHDDVIRLLQNSGKVSVNQSLREDIGGACPIHFAAEGGHASTLQLLVTELGVDVNSRRHDGCTAAMVALLSGHTEIFGLLATQLNADLSLGMTTSPGMAPLHVAAQKGLLDEVKLIDMKGFCTTEPTTASGETALHFAVACNHIPMIKYLVNDMGSNLNAPTLSGITPVFQALVNTQESIAESLVQELIILGGELGTVTNQGFTTLIVAAARGDLPAAKLVLKLGGVNINAFTDAGKTALFCAAENDHDKMVSWLADNGADLNVQTETGSTAAMASAERGNIKTLNVLVRYRADLSLHDKHGNTATSLAVRNGHILKKGVLKSTGELVPSVPPVATILAANNRQQDIDLLDVQDKNKKVFGWTPGKKLVKFCTGDICTNHEPIPASKRRHVKLSVTEEELESAPSAERVSKPWE